MIVVSGGGQELHAHLTDFMTSRHLSAYSTRSRATVEGNAVELHSEAILYLLARHSRVPLSETELVAAVADATESFFARRH